MALLAKDALDIRILSPESRQLLLETSPRPTGSSKLLMNQIDELIFLLSGVCSGYTESPRESNSPERKSLRWPAKVAQAYYLIPPVCS